MRSTVALEQRDVDVDAVRTGDVRGALARDLDEAAGELELVGELVVVDVVGVRSFGSVRRHSSARMSGSGT